MTQKERWHLSSMKAANEQLGIPLPLLRLAKTEGGAAAGYHSSGRINIAALLPWLFDRDTDAKAVVDWQQRLVRAKALYEEERLAKAKSELVRKAAVQDVVASTMSSLFYGIQKTLCADLPPILENQSAAVISHRCKMEIARVTDEQFDRLKAELDALGDDELQEPTAEESAPDTPKKQRPRLNKRMNMTRLQKATNAKK